MEGGRKGRREGGVLKNVTVDEKKPTTQLHVSVDQRYAEEVN